MAKGSKNVTKKQPNAAVRLYRETVGELRKVSWPTPRETRSLSIIVLVVLAIMSAFMGLLDTLLTKLVALLI